MGCDDLSVAAQAAEFIRALRVQLLQMTGRLTWIERQGVTGRSSSREIRLEAGALRRDIQEAQILIDRLAVTCTATRENNSVHLDGSPDQCDLLGEVTVALP